MSKRLVWIAVASIVLGSACDGASGGDDAGSERQDSGAHVDAGQTSVDGGHTDTDAGHTIEDAGTGTDAGTAVASCDLRSSAMYCQEYDFDSDALGPYETACTSGGGTWADAPCPRTGALGGCRTSQAGFGDLTNWFYEGGPYSDASQVMSACAADDPPATYVAP